MANIAVEGTQQNALLDGPTQGKAPEAPLIVRVARVHQVSPFRQMRETTSLRFGVRKLQPKEYYDFGLFDPAMPMVEKRQYVGVAGSKALNQRLSPPELVPTGAFVGNKLFYSAFLNQMGLGAPETQAVFSSHGSFGALQVLRDAAGLEAFLRNDAKYPIFGKPLNGSLSVGSIRIDALKGDILQLGNGQTHRLSAFTEEVMSKYSNGYLFQSALQPHAEMKEITGSAIGCVRVVTVNDTGRPRALYALWKIPSATAMSDNFWQSGSMLAAIDIASGEVTKCRLGTGLDTKDVSHHPETNAKIVGRMLPHWDSVLKIAEDAHGLFPEFGVCGYDIAICEDGPRIVECNDTPFHTLYQLASRRGIYNRDFAPVWKATEDRQAKLLAHNKKLMRKKNSKSG